MDAPRADAPPAMLSLPRWKVPHRNALLLLGVAAVVAVTAYAGSLHHPTAAPLRGPAAERRIASVFELPRNHDGALRGDYMIERFYAVDAETGERYVADFCKGRVVDVSTSTTRPDGLGSYMIVLDREGLQPDRDRLQALSAKEAPLPDPSATYLGLRIQAGSTDAFALNYSGVIPKEYSSFKVPGTSDVFAFLAGQSFADVSAGSRVINVRDTNYVLGSTALFPFLRNAFQLNKAVYVSQLLFLDATSPQAKDTYQEIAQRIPMRP